MRKKKESPSNLENDIKDLDEKSMSIALIAFYASIFSSLFLSFGLVLFRLYDDSTSIFHLHENTSSSKRDWKNCKREILPSTLVLSPCAKLRTNSLKL